MRTFAFIVVFGLFVAGSAPASAVSPVKPPAPLPRVSIDSIDGKASIKLARQLTVLTTCQKACRARVDLTLRTPTNTLRLTRFGRPAAKVPLASTVALSEYGFDYLSMVWRSSSLRVIATAIDVVTSKRTVKSRTFRLRLK